MYHRYPRYPPYPVHLARTKPRGRTFDRSASATRRRGPPIDLYSNSHLGLVQGQPAQSPCASRPCPSLWAGSRALHRSCKLAIHATLDAAHHRNLIDRQHVDKRLASPPGIDALSEASSGAGDHLWEASHIVAVGGASPRLSKAVRPEAALITAHNVRIGQGIRAIAERLQTLPCLSIRRAFGETRQGSAHRPA